AIKKPGRLRPGHRACKTQLLSRVLSRTSSAALPTSRWTLPVFFSTLPSSSLLRSPVALPTPSLTAPLNSRFVPSVLFLSMMFLLLRPASGGGGFPISYTQRHVRDRELSRRTDWDVHAALATARYE